MANRLGYLIMGYDSYKAWREKDHDDLVLATSLAVWMREWDAAHETGPSMVFDRDGRRVL